MFKKLFPWNWFKTVCLAETNKAFAEKKLNPITALGEFIWFFGLLLLMATIGAGFSQEDFWKPNHVKNNPCPYNLITASCPAEDLFASNLSFDPPTTTGLFC